MGFLISFLKTLNMCLSISVFDYTSVCLRLHLSTWTDFICWENVSVLTWTESDLNLLLTLHCLWLWGNGLSLEKVLLSWKLLFFWGYQRIPPSWPESALKIPWGCLFVKTTFCHAGQNHFTACWASISAHCLPLLLELDHEHFGSETLFQYHGILCS